MDPDLGTCTRSATVFAVDTPSAAPKGALNRADAIMRGVYVRRRTRGLPFPHNGDNFSFVPLKSFTSVPLTPTLSNIREKFHYYLHVWVLLAMTFVIAGSVCVFTHFEARCHCNLSGNEIRAAANRYAMVGHHWGRAKIIVDGWLAMMWALTAGWPAVFLLCEVVRGLDMLWCWFWAWRMMRSRELSATGIEKDLEGGGNCLAGEEADAAEMPRGNLPVSCESVGHPAQDQSVVSTTQSEETHNVLVDHGTVRTCQAKEQKPDSCSPEKESAALVTSNVQYWWDADDSSNYEEEEYYFPGWSLITFDFVRQRFDGTVIYMRYPPEGPTPMTVLLLISALVWLLAIAVVTKITQVTCQELQVRQMARGPREASGWDVFCPFLLPNTTASPQVELFRVSSNIELYI
jgi:hypothetical protein